MPWYNVNGREYHDDRRINAQTSKRIMSDLFVAAGTGILHTQRPLSLLLHENRAYRASSTQILRFFTASYPFERTLAQNMHWEASDHPACKVCIPLGGTERVHGVPVGLTSMGLAYVGLQTKELSSRRCDRWKEMKRM